MCTVEWSDWVVLIELVVRTDIQRRYPETNVNAGFTSAGETVPETPPPSYHSIARELSYTSNVSQSSLQCKYTVEMEPYWLLPTLLVGFIRHSEVVCQSHINVMFVMGVDLTKLFSMSMRLSICLSANSYSSFNKIWYAGRCTTHNSLWFDPSQGQC